jgi:hypothetical protein
LCIRPHPGSRSQNAHACDSDQSAFHRLPPFGQIGAGKSNVRVKRMFRQMPGKLLSNPPHCRGGSCQPAPPERVALQGRLPGRGLGNPQGRNAQGLRSVNTWAAKMFLGPGQLFGARRPVSTSKAFLQLPRAPSRYARRRRRRQARRNHRRSAGRTGGWLRHV